jgi:hypothetical protein
MHVIDLGPDRAAPIIEYRSHAAFAQSLADGRGEVHMYLLRLDAGGEIGLHEAGFGQLLIVMAGAGWVAGADGVRHAITVGQGAVIVRGEQHAKGSDMGMIALMIQIADLEMVAAPLQ